MKYTLFFEVAGVMYVCCRLDAIARWYASLSSRSCNVSTSFFQSSAAVDGMALEMRWEVNCSRVLVYGSIAGGVLAEVQCLERT